MRKLNPESFAKFAQFATDKSNYNVNCRVVLHYAFPVSASSVDQAQNIYAEMSIDQVLQKLVSGEVQFDFDVDITGVDEI